MRWPDSNRQNAITSGIQCHTLDFAFAFAFSPDQIRHALRATYRIGEDSADAGAAARVILGQRDRILPDAACLSRLSARSTGAVVGYLCLALLAFYRRDPVPGCNVGTLAIFCLASFTGCF
ncbi:hypothetical protein BKP64_10850 [Marinobacter salinus]|uniref:Uncharacterized protein n=2 Tax=Marinobacter salinus TaxID=1874317 RepID=A0A1D9GLV9_9GAMM|nr:hypothetical protein BKP64_10850 [Marinobacter salinus]